MDDPISRQMAIDEICSECMVANPRSCSTIQNGDKWCMEVYKLMNIPSLQQWAPCSEKLPKSIKKSYWVCTDTGHQYECRWTKNRFGMGDFDEWGWSIFDIPQYSKVVAWMPLPEPYKENNDE